MMDDVMDWIVDNLIWLIVVLFIIVLGASIWEISLEANDPHILLDKTEWRCSHSHTVMLPVVSGKTTVIIPEEICDTYRMNGYE
jgi:hypothetical protein